MTTGDVMTLTRSTLACALALATTFAGAQTTGIRKVGLMLPVTGYRHIRLPWHSH
jgi:hypothetical protein